MTLFVQPEKYIAIGIIQKSKGLQGKMVIRLDYPSLSFSPKLVFLYLEHTYVPYKVHFWEASDNHGVLALAGINDLTKARKLQGAFVFVDYQIIEPLLATSNLRLIGYQVKDVSLGVLGKVSHIERNNFQELLCVEYHGEELRIPIHEELVTHVDDLEKKITTNLPKGYFEGLSLQEKPS